MRFEYRLAGHLGWSREELLDRMDVEEIEDWRVLEKIEPYGEAKLDFLYALSMTNIANFIFKPERNKQFKFKDFELSWEPRKEQTPDDIMRIMTSMMNVMNTKPS